MISHFIGLQWFMKGLVMRLVSLLAYNVWEGY